MNNFFRALIAGYGAKKLGGGCLSTILVFIIIYWALGNCNSTKNRNTAPARSSMMIHSVKTFAPNLQSNKTIVQWRSDLVMDNYSAD